MKSNNIFNELRHGEEILEASAHVYNHLFSFIRSMTLKCAVQLGISDAIRNHGKPLTLSELQRALPIHPQKAQFLPRLMRILNHLGYFSLEKLPGVDNEFGYTLTGAGKLLLKDHPFSKVPMLLVVLDSSFIRPWMDLSCWFQHEDQTPFQTAHGVTLWEYTSYDAEINKNLNEAMACDSRLLASVLIESKHLEGVIDGLSSLVDVGGGLGGMARAIASAYPHIKCNVLDLPQVVDGLKGTDNLTYIAGDMFEGIPQADAVMLKSILHDWGDEDAVKILKQCKEAIASNKSGRRGKVIIVDEVLGDEHNREFKAREIQLLFDMEMMGIVAGKERTEKEWKKLFEDAGFIGGYKIHPVLGFRSFIEVYP